MFYHIRLKIKKYSVQNYNAMSLEYKRAGKSWDTQIQSRSKPSIWISKKWGCDTARQAALDDVHDMDVEIIRRGPKSGVQHPAKQSELYSGEQNSNWYQSRSWNESWQWNKCWLVKHRLIIHQLALIWMPRITAGSGTEQGSARHWERAQHNRAGDD